MKKIAALVVAAGSSSRMGSKQEPQDKSVNYKPENTSLPDKSKAIKSYGGIKQLLPWGDTTLLGHAIDQALAANVEEVVVVLGARYAFIEPSIRDKNVKVLHHESWENGLGSSIAYGVNFIDRERESNAVLITLADQPLIDTAYLNSLISHEIENPKQIIATQYLNKIGVPALFPKKYFKDLIKLDKDYGAKHILNNPEANVLVIDGKERIADIDTPEDYEKLKGCQK